MRPHYESTNYAPKSVPQIIELFGTGYRQKELQRLFVEHYTTFNNSPHLFRLPEPNPVLDRVSRMHDLLFHVLQQKYGPFIEIFGFDEPRVNYIIPTLIFCLTWGLAYDAKHNQLRYRVPLQEQWQDVPIPILEHSIKEWLAIMNLRTLGGLPAGRHDYMTLKLIKEMSLNHSN